MKVDLVVLKCKMWLRCHSPHLAPAKNQAISFKAIKACYPFTIKGEIFSLLCYQPEAVPASLKTLTPETALRNQYLPLI